MLEIIGLIVLAIIAFKILIGAFFLIVPTFSDLNWKHRLGGMVLIAVSLSIWYYIFTNLPFSVTWNK